MAGSTQEFSGSASGRGAWGRGAFALLLAVGLWAPEALAHEGTDWTIGRTSEVFRTHSAGIATRVGGWFDASYEDSNLKGAERSVNLNHFDLFFDTRFRDHWQLFLETEFENESNVTGFDERRGYRVAQLYGRYTWSDNLDLQVGRFNTPFGFWTPIHWNILMDSIRSPLHESRHIAPEQQQGFALHGSVFPSSEINPLAELRYSVFTGFGSDETEGSAENSPEGWSAGADLRLGLWRGDFAGVSYYQQRHDIGADRFERNVSLYSQIALSEKFTVLGEYVMQIRSREAGPAFDRRLDIGYGILRWQLHPKYYLSYRFNWGDDDLQTGTDTRHVHTLTLGYTPTRSLRLKLEFADHSFRDGRQSGFRYWAVSIGGLF